MKIILYSIGDSHGKRIKDFLNKHNLNFKEIPVKDKSRLDKIARTNLPRKISILKVKKSHGIHVHLGFIKHQLNNLIKHIEKYNPKLE